MVTVWLYAVKSVPEVAVPPADARVNVTSVDVGPVKVKVAA